VVVSASISGRLQHALPLPRGGDRADGAANRSDAAFTTAACRRHTDRRDSGGDERYRNRRDS
jgi:hypothetical protein